MKTFIWFVSILSLFLEIRAMPNSNIPNDITIIKSEPRQQIRRSLLKTSDVSDNPNDRVIVKSEPRQQNSDSPNDRTIVKLEPQQQIRRSLLETLDALVPYSSEVVIYDDTIRIEIVILKKYKRVILNGTYITPVLNLISGSFLSMLELKSPVYVPWYISDTEFHNVVKEAFPSCECYLFKGELFKGELKEKFPYL